MSFRIGIIGIQHESNTFLTSSTTLDDFHRDIDVEGSGVITRMRAAHHEVAGLIAEFESADVEMVPLLFARAMPSGIIEKAATEQFFKRVAELLKSAGPLDGLMVAPHGAAVSAAAADFDGEWLSICRGIVGPGVPIVCTIDPHANLSERMIAACDATIAYRTNPHLDQRDRGIEAARLMLRHLRGEVRLVQAASRPPLIINIERQCTRVEPCVSLYQRAETIRQKPGVLSVSIVLGFPYADVSDMGSAFIVVSDGDQTLARDEAERLSRFALARRSDYVGQLISPDDALRLAASTDGINVLLDMGDNVGGGGPADETTLIAALHRSQLGPAIATVFDPQAVHRAVQIGVGATGEFTLGARDQSSGKPFSVRATVAGVYKGTFTETQPRHGGATHFDMGPTAVLKTEKLTLVVTSRRLFPVSLEQYPACNINIANYRYIVAKGVHAPVGAYEALRPRFIHVNTPGVTSADLTHFTFTARRRPLFPFEEIG